MMIQIYLLVGFFTIVIFSIMMICKLLCWVIRTFIINEKYILKIVSERDYAQCSEVEKMIDDKLEEKALEKLSNET